MKVIWITDPHLDTLSALHGRETVETYLEEIKERDPDMVFITGDIANGTSIVRYLGLIGQHLDSIPVYFVLGNHDYYGSDILKVRKSVCLLADPRFNCLDYVSVPARRPVYENGTTTYIIGLDGWADARCGNYKLRGGTKIRLNDAVYIKDLSDTLVHFNLFHPDNWRPLRDKMRYFADADLAPFSITLENLTVANPAKYHSKIRIIVLTHVPPFKENALYDGKISDPEFLPFYVNTKLGKLLLDYAKYCPDIQYLVFCGHAHSRATYQPLPNLTVRTGFAEYGKTHYEVLEL